MENHAKKVHQKLAPDPILILVNNPKQSCIQEILLKIRYFERGLGKSLEKLLWKTKAAWN